MTRFSTLAIALMFTAAEAAAEPPTRTSATESARAAFQNGLTLAQQGDLHAALAAFETAYAAQPHFSVLYNIGQARAALGRPVEAVAAFERYLADGGKHISEARRAEVHALIVANRERMGNLRIEGGPIDARVWLDGAELSQAARRDALLLAKGEHTLIVWNGIGAPESRIISVSSQEVIVTIPDAPTRTEPPHPKPAYVAIACKVPGVRVEVDGGSITTPQQRPWPVPAGRISLSFSRPGYPRLTKTVLATEGEQTAVDCNQHPLSPLPPQWAARLSLVLDPPDAEVLVDGDPYTSRDLPHGVHDIRVQRDGFAPLQRQVSLEPGRTKLLSFSLVPTPLERARQEHAKTRTRTTALVLAGLGLGALAGSAGVYAWNSSRYDDWRKNQVIGKATADDAARIQRGDDAAMGLLISGATLSISGGWFFFHSP